MLSLPGKGSKVFSSTPILHHGISTRAHEKGKVYVKLNPSTTPLSKLSSTLIKEQKVTGKGKEFIALKKQENIKLKTESTTKHVASKINLDNRKNGIAPRSYSIAVIGDETDETIEKIENQKNQVEKYSFHEKLSSILKTNKELSPKKNEEVKTVKLHAWLQSLNRGDELALLPEYQLTTLMQELYNLGDHEGVLWMMENCSKPKFHNIINQEFFVRSAIASGLKHQDQLRLNKGLPLISSMLEANPNNAEALFLKGQYMEAFVNIRNTPTSSKELDNSILDSYTKSFNISKDATTGRALMLHQIKLGQIENAESTARIVNLIYLRDGALESPSHESALSNFLGSIILGEEFPKIQMLQQQIFSLETETWKILDGRDVLKNFLSIMEEAGLVITDPEISGLLEETIATLDTRAAWIENHINSEAYTDKLSHASLQSLGRENRDIDDWKNKSYSYRGLNSNVISGNFKFGGIVPDHAINRFDRLVFNDIVHSKLGDIIDFKSLTEDRKIQLGKAFNLKTEDLASLENIKLIDIEDPDSFSLAADTFVRWRLHTDTLDLEELNSKGHALFEELIEKATLGSGILAKQKSVSKTNVSATLTFGLGDCRQHAQIKQLLWDTWQHQRVNSLINAYVEAASEDDKNDLLKKIEKTLEPELRIQDVAITAPIQMEARYKHARDEAGNLQKSNQLEDIELHTLSILIKNGNIKLMDSFYNNHYNFNDVTIDTKAIRDPSYKAGEKEVIDPQTKKAVKVPVYLSPEPYSKKRDVNEPASMSLSLFGSELPKIEIQDIKNTESVLKKMKKFEQLVRE